MASGVAQRTLHESLSEQREVNPNDIPLYWGGS